MRKISQQEAMLCLLTAIGILAASFEAYAAPGKGLPGVPGEVTAVLTAPSPNDCDRERSLLLKSGVVGMENTSCSSYQDGFGNHSQMLFTFRNQPSQWAAPLDLETCIWAGRATYDISLATNQPLGGYCMPVAEQPGKFRLVLATDDHIGITSLLFVKDLPICMHARNALIDSGLGQVLHPGRCQDATVGFAAGPPTGNAARLEFNLRNPYQPQALEAKQPILRSDCEAARAALTARIEEGNGQTSIQATCEMESNPRLAKLVLRVNPDIADSPDSGGGTSQKAGAGSAL